MVHSGQLLFLAGLSGLILIFLIANQLVHDIIWKLINNLVLVLIKLYLIIYGYILVSIINSILDFTTNHMFL